MNKSKYHHNNATKYNTKHSHYGNRLGLENLRKHTGPTQYLTLLHACRVIIIVIPPRRQNDYKIWFDNKNCLLSLQYRLIT